LLLLHQPLGHPSQVLSRCRKQELISCSGQSSQAKPIELQDALQVGEEHLDLLALPLRLGVPGRLGDLATHISRLFVDAACDLADRRVGAAGLLQRPSRAVVLVGAIDDGVGLGDVIARLREVATFAAKCEALRTPVLVGLRIP
jgi:hypothetical protein